MRAFIKNVIFSAVIVTAIFCGLEAFQRVRYYVARKDASYLFYGGTNIELRLSKYIERWSHPNVDTKEIITVGGSTVECIGIPRHMAWPQQLESILKTNGYRHLSVANLGEGGSDSKKDVDRLRSYLRSHPAPAMIIFYSGINDSATMLAAKIDGKVVLKEEINADFPNRLNAVLMKRSLFYVTLREKLTKMIAGNIDQLYAPRPDGMTDDRLVEIDDLGVQRFRTNVLSVIQLARQLDAALVLGSPPISQRMQNYRRSFDKLRAETRNIAEAYGLPYIDMDLIFSAMNADDELYLPDGVHVNQKGAQKQAEIIYGFLTDNNLVGR